MKRLASLRSLATYDRDSVDEDGVEFVGDFEIVGRAEGAPAQVVEVEARNAAGRLRHVKTAAEQLDLDRLAALMAGQSEEGGVERAVSLRPKRRVIDRRADELFQPVVRPRVELDNVEPLAQQPEERQKERAIEPVLVEVVRRHVRRRDDDDAGFEQGREQPAQDHRVGDVAHRELVEAEKGSLARELRGDRADRVFADDFAPLARLTPSMQAGVHIGHEAVEMRAPLGADLDRLEEEIHQHRLAAPDRAIDIEAARRLGRLQPHESGEGARPLILGAIALEPEAQRLERVGEARLRRVEFEAMIVNERAVSLRDGGHAKAVTSGRAVKSRHCEERSDEAIQGFVGMRRRRLDCFPRAAVGVAMTAAPAVECLNAPPPSSAPRALRPEAAHAA